MQLNKAFKCTLNWLSETVIQALQPQGKICFNHPLPPRTARSDLGDSDTLTIENSTREEPSQDKGTQQMMSSVKLHSIRKHLL
jgi:hypothetical protein